MFWLALNMSWYIKTENYKNIVFIEFLNLNIALKLIPLKRTLILHYSFWKRWIFCCHLNHKVWETYDYIAIVLLLCENFLENLTSRLQEDFDELIGEDTVKKRFVKALTQIFALLLNTKVDTADKSPCLLNFKTTNHNMKATYTKILSFDVILGS